MARIVKEYDERYTEFLNTAQALFFTRGYAATSVQEIIRAVGVAKGTFYHYFSSKADILEAIVQRLYEQSILILEPIMNDTTLGAVAKLERFIGVIGQWKATQKTEMMETARALYRDENILLREKMRQRSIMSIVPLLSDIIEQGVAEGVFDVEYPLEAAEIVIGIIRVVTENATAFLLSGQRDVEAIQRIKRQFVLCNRSVARVLGMSAENQALTLFETDYLDDWLEN